MNCSASLNSSSCQKRQNKTFQLAATRVHGVTHRRTEGHLSVVSAHRQPSRRLVNTASQHEREKKRRKKRRRYRPLRLLFGGCQLGLEAKWLKIFATRGRPIPHCQSTGGPLSIKTISDIYRSSISKEATRMSLSIYLRPDVTTTGQ